MITKELVILARIIDELDGVETGTLEERIIFQKKIYLSQACGLNLGYNFSWDLYGPYSKSLAQNTEIYEKNKKEVDDFAKKIDLSEDAKEKIDHAKCLMEHPEGNEIKESTWLELMSSLHYMVVFRFKKVCMDQGLRSEIDEINDSLIGKKPHLEQYRDLLPSAWKRLWSCPCFQ